jgi:hypothetical protein
MVRGSLGGKRAPGAVSQAGSRGSRVFGEAQTVGDFAEENARDESEDGSRPREVFFFVFFFVFFIFFVTTQRRLLRRFFYALLLLLLLYSN